MARPTYSRSGGYSQYASDHGIEQELAARERAEDENDETLFDEENPMSVQETIELPVWKPVLRPLEPPPPLEEELFLTAPASVILQHGPHGWGWLRIMMHSYDIPQEWAPLPAAELRSQTLRFLLAEAEKALPVLRAVVEALDATATER